MNVIYPGQPQGLKGAKRISLSHGRSQKESGTGWISHSLYQKYITFYTPSCSSFFLSWLHQRAAEKDEVQQNSLPWRRSQIGGEGLALWLEFGSNQRTPWWLRGVVVALVTKTFSPVRHPESRRLCLRGKMGSFF